MDAQCFKILIQSECKTNTAEESLAEGEGGKESTAPIFIGILRGWNRQVDSKEESLSASMTLLHFNVNHWNN